MLFIYNSISRTKEKFIPITPGIVKIYVCGQTVYDYCHIGHARKAIVFDIIRRWLIQSGYRVTFVENITDIDDKIIARAKLNNESAQQLATKFTIAMQQDFKQLNILPPDMAPKATEYIPQIIDMIDKLIKQGNAYKASNNDIYYRVRSFDEYGKLSGKQLEDLQSGARVAIDRHKEDPLDFVLWKADELGEYAWESSFGRGRPGWHIECSAMSFATLGETFDIHGGGQDLQFPHHENEIAQSEACNHKKLANYWVHNGFLNISNSKMSKSLHNSLNLRTVLSMYHPETIRMLILRTHYRSPIELNHNTLDDAKHLTDRLYNCLKNLSSQIQAYKSHIYDHSIYAQFAEAMNDDFNTPVAMNMILELINEINKNPMQNLVNCLINMLNSLGIFNNGIRHYFEWNSNIDPEYIKELIATRQAARQIGNFKLADQIRAELLNMGIVIEDNNHNTSWRVI